MNKIHIMSLVMVSMMISPLYADQSNQSKQQDSQSSPQPALQMPGDEGYVMDPFSSNWDPLTDMMRIQTKMEEFLDRNFGGKTRSTLNPPQLGSSLYQPSMDLVETESEIIIHVDMPGVVKEGIGVEVINRVLHITGNRKLEYQTGQNIQGIQYRLQERSFGSFKRSVKLPDYADVSKVKAEYRNGILSVRIPKTQKAEAEPLKVPIQ